ncbi:phosphoglycolate phosphatase [Erythrobacter sp. QSSC1-22B]|uniref:HAD-IA family hydrolase n=1 Tax=Erythrobacter sp. QSSC1-22B TaxID=1860125 RepID=UPI00080526D4|nr:HAD-IA family hydrolase [Erythrobacter sp. QSSC1-22B]OBX20746.1 phosphoglycolate phosphatase [Erythrobacter sp. QSSC1-22B]
MVKFPFDIVAFDLDGTLLDSFRDLGAAVNHALEIGGFEPVPVESSKDLIGGGAKVMLARAVERQGGLPEDEFHPLYKQMLTYYAANNAVHSRAYPGAEDCLDALAGRGVKLAVVTNKFEEFAREILTKLDLADRFETIIGGDTMGKGRAKPEPDSLIEARGRCGGGSFAFVGDSTYDVMAARAAQVPVVGARYGYCDKPPGELGADVEIDSLAALIPALEGLTPA